MPPRKRARISQAASPTPTSQPKTPTVDIRSADDDILNEPWTDEEEIGLFKALIRWKPTGIHKHFRMIQLRSYLLENNYIHPRNAHSNTAGIWRKLESLYDLEALDQREDARQLSDYSENSNDDEDEEDEDDVYSLAANKIHNETFLLPDVDFGSRMWAQRLASEKERRDESPPALPELNMADDAPVRFTRSFSIEPEDIATPVPRSARGRPPKGAAKRRSAVPARRRSQRQTESVVAGSEEEVVEGDEEEGEDSDGEDEVEEEEQEESERSTPAPRSVRGRRSGVRGSGAPRGRPRGRRR